VVCVDVELEVHYFAFELEGLKGVLCDWGHHGREQKRNDFLVRDGAWRYLRALALNNYERDPS
jgi:hypothetical protein